MKEPVNFEIKKWLYDNEIIGVIVYYYQTGTDTADTDWQLITFEGDSKRFKKDLVFDLLQYQPDWVRIFELKKEYREEVKEWMNFVKNEEKDLKEYKRLKKKFEE